MLVTLIHLEHSFGGNLVFKKPSSRPRRSTNPMVLLDYRCYAPGGKIGKDYPPELTQARASVDTHCLGLPGNHIDWCFVVCNWNACLHLPHAQCLQRLSALTPQAIMDKYGFPMLRNAEVLQSRAQGGSGVIHGWLLVLFTFLRFPLPCRHAGEGL